MFKSSFFRSSILIVVLTLLVGVGAVSANFVRNPITGTSSSSPGSGSENSEAYAYGYGYWYGYGYGYGYGYRYGSVADTAFGGIYGFFGSDGSATIDSVTVTATTIDVNFTTDYTTTGSALFFGSELMATEGYDASGARSLQAKNLTCNTEYEYTLTVTDKGGNDWDAAGVATTSACTTASSSSGGGSTNGGTPLLNSGWRPISIQGWLGIMLPHNIVLRPGTHHQKTIALQIILNHLGFTVSEKGAGSRGREDGFYGKKTKKAVAKLQAMYGLKPDGIYGPKTEAVMRTLLK